MKPFEIDVSSQYGAPMGRRSDPEVLGSAHLEKVPFVDGDYDSGGAYWGQVDGSPLWCAWNDSHEAYFRAPDLKVAQSVAASLGATIIPLDDPKENLAAFFEGYCTAALWSSRDSDEDSQDYLDQTHSIEDIAPETHEKMLADCQRFLEANAADVATLHDSAEAGHCFWLDRCGHGTGFWDRRLGAVGERLHRAAKAFGECDLYVGDDNKIYVG